MRLDLGVVPLELRDKGEADTSFRVVLVGVPCGLGVRGGFDGKTATTLREPREPEEERCFGGRADIFSRGGLGVVGGVQLSLDPCDRTLLWRFMPSLAAEFLLWEDLLDSIFWENRRKRELTERSLVSTISLLLLFLLTLAVVEVCGLEERERN